MPASNILALKRLILTLSTLDASDHLDGAKPLYGALQISL